MITLHDLAYVRIGTQDLDTQVEFASEIVGLELVERTATSAFLRADDRRHCVQFVKGTPGQLSSAFSLATGAELDAAHAELHAAGVDVRRGTPKECGERRVRDFIAFTAPGGSTVELVTGQVRLQSRPVAFARQAGITEFGHLGLEAPDVVAAHEFWGEHFNLQVSDWIGTQACLMRFDPVHHKLALFAEETGLGHVNFQVSSIDDIMRSANFLKYHGVDILMGPGRHPQSTAIFLYFTGPEGVTWEYSHGVRRIEEDEGWVPRVFDTNEPDFIDMWKGALATAGQPWKERHP